MEGMARGYTGLCIGGIGCCSRWVPGSAGMATPGILLAQLFKTIMCFGWAFCMEGVLSVMADKGFLGVLLAFWNMLCISCCYIKGAGFT